MLRLCRLRFPIILTLLTFSASGCKVWPFAKFEQSSAGSKSREEATEKIPDHKPVDLLSAKSLHGGRKLNQNRKFAIHNSTGFANISGKKLASLNVDTFALNVRHIIRRHMTLEAAGNVLRLCFHDAGTFNKSAGTGGANGSIRLKGELNQGIDLALDLAMSVILKSKLEADATLEPPPELAALGEVTISFADLIMLAGVEATVFTGGPDFSIPLGRPDALVPDSTAMLPIDATLVQAQKALFLSNGYSVRELVTLEGAHTLGFSRLHAFKGPMTATPLAFDNDYYIELLRGGGLFPSDSTLVKDPETLQIVREFANDQNAFFKSWVNAFRNMSIKGAPLLNLRGGL